MQVCQNNEITKKHQWKKQFGRPILGRGKTPRSKRPTYIYTQTDICVTSLPVFDALSFHNTFEDAKANESLCAFQNMYLEINKKTQQMSKLYGVITDTVKYQDNILKQGPIEFTDTVLYKQSLGCKN